MSMSTAQHGTHSPSRRSSGASWIRGMLDQDSSETQGLRSSSTCPSAQVK